MMEMLYLINEVSYYLSFDMMVMMNIVFVVLLTDERCLALFPARSIDRDPHHGESLTLCKQDLKVHRT